MAFTSSFIANTRKLTVFMKSCREFMFVNLPKIECSS